MKLVLSSFNTTDAQDEAVARLIGKQPHETRVGYIENAHDVYNDEAALLEGRAILTNKGYQVELVDLRNWLEDKTGLREVLARQDMFLLAGGNPFYLRWLMHATGADALIIEFVRQGKVYSGASAAAVVAGPTLRGFELVDDPNEAKEIIWDGLNLTPIVVVPHIDNADFGEGCRAAGDVVMKAGYPTRWIKDDQALMINGDEQQLI